MKRRARTRKKRLSLKQRQELVKQRRLERRCEWVYSLGGESFIKNFLELEKEEFDGLPPKLQDKLITRTLSLIGTYEQDLGEFQWGRAVKRK